MTTRALTGWSGQGQGRTGGVESESILREYDRPVLFYVLATAFPWGFWSLAALLSRLPHQNEPVLIGTLLLSVAGLLSPLAVVFLLIRPRPALVADVVNRLHRPKGRGWFCVVCAVALPFLSLMAAQGLSLLFGHGAEQFQLRTGFSFSSGLMPVWVTLLGAAVVEELAWHSYGTDTLVRKMRVFSASLLFTLIWALWHVPLSFIDGYYQNEVVKSGLLYTLNFPASMVAFVVLMNWLYFRSGRSIIVPIVFHAAANVSAELFMTDPDSKVLQTGLLLVLSTVIVISDRALFFGVPRRRAERNRSAGSEARR